MNIMISEVPLSKNKYINLHWIKRREYKKVIAWVIFEAIKLQAIFVHSDIKYPLKKATIKFDIYFKVKRRRDIANYLGGGLIVWIDVLVDRGIIKDDCYDCIGQPLVNFYIDKANPRKEIIIEAMG